MSTSSGAFMRSTQRSSSSTRGSRRSTLAIGAGEVLPGLHAGSLSPERALRTRVREKDDVNGNQLITNDANGKPKFATKAVSKGATRPQQQVHFAFGSKVTKPAFGKGATTAATGESRGRSANAETGIVVPRQRRERSARLSTLEEPRASTRGSTATNARQQSIISTKEPTDGNNLKAQLQNKENTIANLRRQLGSQTAADGLEVSGRPNGHAAGSAVESSEIVDGDETFGAEGVGAAPKAVEGDLREDVEELIMRMEAMASTGLSRVERMQANVDEMIRMLKAQKK